MTIRFSLRPLTHAALLAALALGAGAATAQQTAPRIVPLTRDPARAPRRQAVTPGQAVNQLRTAALTLPFFDDFARDDSPAPNPLRWQPGGALQNNRFADAPPTKGVATLDGFNAYGEPYGGLSPNVASDLDTLVSQPIDLAGRASASIAFWWQRGGVGDNILAPGTRARLTLDVDDGSGFWQQIWEKRGSGNDSAFARAEVAIPAALLTANCRFRFRFRGTYNDIVHCWNVDYVEINPDRPPGPVRDIATSHPLPPALRRYSAMPVWQYNAAAAAGSEIADSSGTTLSNMELGQEIPTPTSSEGKFSVRLADGTLITDNAFLTDSRVVETDTFGMPLGGPLRAALPAQPVPLSPDYKLLQQTIIVNGGDPALITQHNDTIRRVDELADYYAYGDGSAEAGFTLSAVDPSSAAYAFDADVADQVAGISLYLPGDLVTGQRLFVEVWPDDPAAPGQPAPTSLIRVGFNVPGDSLLRVLGRWYHIWFLTPQPVSGRFYAGYSQPANSGFVNIGFDLNDTTQASGRLHFRFGQTGTWGISRTPGSLLVRPRMNNNGAVGLPEAATVAAPAVFPNPVSAADGMVRVQGEYTAATLLDALGRPVRTLAANAPALDVRDLPAGVYALRFRTANGAGATRRLVLTR